MTLVVDASVVVKWVVQERESNLALALRDNPALIAPSLIGAEVANALWKAVGRHHIQESDAIAALKAAMAPIERLVPGEELDIRALEMAIRLKHPIYDCFYLALAEREDAPLITADQRLLKAGRRLKGVEVRSL